MENLNTKIRAARKLSRLTQEQLAKKVGVVVQTIRKYEAGISEPTASVLAKIADATGVEITFFFGEDRHIDYAAEEAKDLINVAKSIAEMEDEINRFKKRYKETVEMYKRWGEVKTDG